MELYLRRKRIADWLLLLSAVLLMGCLITATFFQNQFALEWQRRLLRMLTFMAEAALVASVADYIAVTALTKQILWFKSTGLISKKREEIIKSIVKAIEEKLFTRELLLAELESKKFDEMIIGYMGTPSFKEDTATLLETLITGMVKDQKKIGEYMERPVKEFLKKIDFRKLGIMAKNAELLKEADPYIIKLGSKIEKLVDSDDFSILIDKTFSEAIEKQKEASKLNRFMFFLGEKTNILNVHDLAKEIKESIIDELELFKGEENYKGRQELADKLLQSLMKGLEGRAMTVELQRLKNREIDDLDIKGGINELITKLVPFIEGKASVWLTEDLVKGLADYVSIEKNFINMELRSFLVKLIESEYGSMLKLTEDMLNRLSDKNLVDKVNEIAGGDLQWLRISGSIIGLAAGVFCFIIMEFPLFGVPLGVGILLLLKFSKSGRKLLVSYPYGDY